MLRRRHKFTRLRRWHCVFYGSVHGDGEGSWIIIKHVRAFCSLTCHLGWQQLQAVLNKNHLKHSQPSPYQPPHNPETARKIHKWRAKIWKRICNESAEKNPRNTIIIDYDQVNSHSLRACAVYFTKAQGCLVRNLENRLHVLLGRIYRNMFPEIIKIVSKIV